MATFDGVPILSALKYGSDQVSKGCIETIISGVPMLEEIPHLTFAGRVYEQEHEGTLPNVAFRNINETYDADFGDDDASYWGTGVLGGESVIDLAIWNVVDDRDRLKQRTITKLAKSTGMRYSWEFFNGDGNNKGFKGLERLIADGHGIHHDPGADGPLNFDELDEAIIKAEAGPLSAILCNKEIALRFSHRARSGYTEFTLLESGTTKLGERVKMYDGTPIRIVRRGLNASNEVEQCLPFDESGTTTSIYLVTYGEEAVTGLVGANGSFEARWLGELQDAPAHKARLECYPGLASFDAYACVRYSRITNA